MEHLISLLSQYMIPFVEDFGYIAIFILMSLESAFIPIPSEVTMPFAGYMASQGKLNFWIVILIGGLANLFGSLVIYYIGYRWKEKANMWARKYGKYVFLNIKEVETTERWFRDHGEIIAFASRLLPFIRTFISLPAGVAGMNVKKFSIYSLVGSLIWSFVLTYIGFSLGRNWHSISTYFQKFHYLIFAIIGLSIAWFVWYKIKSRRGKH